MDDGLPIVGPDVDLSQAPPINHKRILAFLNHFITHSVRFLNRFSCVCEEKLAEMQARIQRLEITLSILEAKLASIPGLENIAPVNKTAPQQDTTTAATPAVTDAQPAESQNTSKLPSQNEEPTPAPAEPEKPSMTVSKDPRYIKYFKMLNFGVPAGAVKTKMAAEGLNPDLLDTPDAPVTDSSSIPKEDTDYSDSGNDDSDSDSDASSFTDSD